MKDEKVNFLRSLLKGDVRVRNMWEPFADELEKAGLIRGTAEGRWELVSREEAEKAIAVGVLGRL